MAVGLILGFILLLSLAAIFIWLATRAWRIKFPLLRWPAVVLSSLVSLIIIAVIVLAGVGTYRLNIPSYAYANPTAGVPITGAQEQVARGQQIAMLCTGCHSSSGDLPLDGGRDFLAGGPPLGTISPPNLTPSGPLKNWTDAQIIRAIREGVDNQGHPLVIMPSDGLHGMSDADAAAVVAYLRSQPPSPHNVPSRSFNVLGYALFGTGLFPTSAQPPITGPVNAPPRAATAEYGHYLTTAFLCESCHGPKLTGGSTGGGGPAAPDLTAIVPHWSQSDFLTFFRTGVAPGGAQISTENMPWQTYSKVFTDQDLTALYLYLHTLSAAQPAGS